MQKLLCLLLISFSFFLEARAITNPYLMDQERFVHLSPEDKRSMIIKTMETMVDLEAMYAKEVRTSQIETPKIKKIVTLLQQLRSFIISEAVAADFGSMGKNFSDLLAKKKDKACIYGGWISETTKDSSGNIFCIHPAFALDKQIRDAYKSNSGSCSSSSQITCNPMVFGFKKAEGEKLFCVDTGYTATKTNKAHNVSYECMRAALSSETVQGQDTKEKRLKDMESYISNSKNKDAFDKVHKYIFDLCACGKGEMNTAYKMYVRPHRTCFGMINTMRSMRSSECMALTDSLPKNDQEFMKKWNDFFNDKNIAKLSVPANRSPESFDKDYKALIESSPVQNYCSGTKPPQDQSEWICRVKCTGVTKPEPNKPAYKCEVISAGKKNKEKVEPVEISSLSESLVTAESKTIEAVLKDGKKEICNVTIETIKNEVEATCSLAIKEEKEDQATISLSLVSLKSQEVDIKWGAGTPSKDNLETLITKTDKDQDIGASAKVKSSGKELKCQAIKISAKGKTEQKSCNVKVEDDKEAPLLKSLATVTLTGAKEEEITAVEWSIGTAGKEKQTTAVIEKTEADQELKVKVTLKSDTSKPIECSAATVPKKAAANDTNSYGITAKADDYKNEDSSITIKAAVSMDGKEVKLADLDGFKITWKREGDGVASIKAPEAKSSSGVSDSEDGKVETAAAPTSADAGSGESITEPRVDKDYKSCASLIDKDGKLANGSSPSCVTIPAIVKKDTPPTINNNNYNNYRPQQPNFNFQRYNSNMRGID